MPYIIIVQTYKYFNKNLRVLKIFTFFSLIFNRLLDKIHFFTYNQAMQKLEMMPIGYIQTDFKEKFGIPRQSGRAEHLRAKIIFYPPFNSEEAFREIEGFSHLWLLFDFSLTKDKGYALTVRPPRLGGNKKVGVFASRSPFRPNHIGLSVVKLEKVEKDENGKICLIVLGADLLDNTPIIDVKPYLPLADCILDATGGYSSTGENHRLTVRFSERLLSKIPADKQQGLIECLADDPRPAYKTDSANYGMKFDAFNIKFSVEKDILTVTDVERLYN